MNPIKNKQNLLGNVDKYKNYSDWTTGVIALNCLYNVVGVACRRGLHCSKLLQDSWDVQFLQSTVLGYCEDTIVKETLSGN